jgi:hypothetical protein
MRSLIVQTVKSSLISDRAQQGWNNRQEIDGAAGERVLV